MWSEALDHFLEGKDLKVIKPTLLFQFPEGIALKAETREMIDFQRAFDVVWETGAFDAMRMLYGKVSVANPVLEIYPPDILILRFKPERVIVPNSSESDRPIWRSLGVRTQGTSYDDVHIFVTQFTLKTPEGLKIKAGGWQEVPVNKEVDTYVADVVGNARYLATPYLDSRTGLIPRSLFGLSESPMKGKRIELTSRKEILLR